MFCLKNVALARFSFSSVKCYLTWICIIPEMVEIFFFFRIWFDFFFRLNSILLIPYTCSMHTRTKFCCFFCYFRAHADEMNKMINAMCILPYWFFGEYVFWFDVGCFFCRSCSLKYTLSWQYINSTILNSNFDEIFHFNRIFFQQYIPTHFKLKQNTKI